MGSGPRRPLLLAALCWALFAVLLLVAYHLPVARWADGWSVAGFLNLQRPWLDPLAHRVAQLADPGPFALWALALAGIALYRRRPRLALAVLFLLVGANVTSQVLKPLLAEHRWHGFLGHAQISDGSFPSGHATASMALALGAILVASPRWRPLVAVGGALFALAVSESVMLLAWHFPSDVAGGFLVATSFALASVAGLRAAQQRWPEKSGRAAARRALDSLDVRRIALTVAAFVVAALTGVAVAAGDAAVRFAGRHTTAVVAACVVAALAAALRVTVASFGARRS